MVEKKVLETSRAFRQFWKKNGPYKYALTCSEFPPVLLDDEQWLFSNDIIALLKALMQFDERKMKFVQAPFNPKNTSILRPETLSAWKINNFPEEWNACTSDFFIPEGHLTQTLLDALENEEKEVDAAAVEALFFDCLEKQISQMGYVLLFPEKQAKNASIHAYLEEWEEDEKDAGLFE